MDMNNYVLVCSPAQWGAHGVTRGDNETWWRLDVAPCRREGVVCFWCDLLVWVSPVQSLWVAGGEAAEPAPSNVGEREKINPKNKMFNLSPSPSGSKCIPTHFCPCGGEPGSPDPRYASEVDCISFTVRVVQRSESGRPLPVLLAASLRWVAAVRWRGGCSPVAVRAPSRLSGLLPVRAVVCVRRAVRLAEGCRFPCLC